MRYRERESKNANRVLTTGNQLQIGRHERRRSIFGLPINGNGTSKENDMVQTKAEEKEDKTCMIPKIVVDEYHQGIEKDEAAQTISKNVKISKKICIPIMTAIFIIWYVLVVICGRYAILGT